MGVRGSRELAERVALARVLLVDDEPDLCAAVDYSLRRAGYTVDVAVTGTDALAKARADKPDLIVLDIMLPGMDGLVVCQRLRAESDVPILLLSAKGEEADRVTGLELGADDYLTKPFAMRELLARIAALLRRSRMLVGTGSVVGQGNAEPTSAFPALEPAAPESGEQLRAGELTIDRARHQVTLRGRSIAMRPIEFELLHHFASHPGIVFSRGALLRAVWGYNYPIETRTVDVHVRWLRQKLEVDPSQPRWIETVRGIGYRFVAGPADSTS